MKTKINKYGKVKFKGELGHIKWRATYVPKEIGGIDHMGLEIFDPCKNKWVLVFYTDNYVEECTKEIDDLCEALYRCRDFLSQGKKEKDKEKYKEKDMMEELMKFTNGFCGCNNKGTFNPEFGPKQGKKGSFYVTNHTVSLKDK